MDQDTHTSSEEAASAASSLSCTKCDESKPATLEHFPPAKAKRNGLASWCRDCKREAQRSHNLKARPRPRIEERECARSSCDSRFEWNSEYGRQKYCSRDCWERDKRRIPDLSLASVSPSAVLARSCISCHRLLPGSSFHKAANRPLGLQSECKSCQRVRWVVGKYKVDRATAVRLIAARECDLCGSAPLGRNENLDIDHCHTSGIVRGVLCNRCNKGLGAFSDDVELMRRAITYIEDSR